MLAHPSWKSALPGPRSGLGSYVPWKRRRGFLHFLLQSPFRRMGKRFPAFEETLRAGRRLAAAHDRVFDLDDLRQVLTLACVRRHLDLTGPETFAVIGDGYGRLAGLLLATLPQCRVALVNLDEPLQVDLDSLRRVWPELDRVTAIPAGEARVLANGPLGGAFNVSSMQEMDPAAIAEYFRILRSAPSSTWFYCSNATEKHLPDGTAVRFLDYPWDRRDAILLDELCPWAQRNYQMWPPRYFPRLYRIRHRLVRLHKS